MMKKLFSAFIIFLIFLTAVVKPSEVKAYYDNTDFSDYDEESFPVLCKFDLMPVENEYCSWYFEFNDNWFKDDARGYNHKLARLSLGMAMSAFRSSVDKYSLENPSLHLQDFLKQCGFSNLRMDDYDKNPTLYTVATVIAQKPIRDEQGEFTLLAVGVCGAKYQNEWLSNFSIGDENIHAGFKSASEEVYDRLFGYIAQNGLSGKRLKVWVSGFSRAAAVSNLFAKKLDDTDLFDEEDVFAYTFATPRNNKEPIHYVNRYINIHNICGKMDPVPQVPFADWGYTRYGRTLYLPAQQTDSDFLEKFQKADEVYYQITGLPLWNNVEWDTKLRIIMNYLLRIVPSAKVYKEHVQDRLISIWENRSVSNIITQLFEIASDPEIVTEENKDEADSLMTYVSNVLLGTLTKSDINSIYYNESATIAGNLALEHTPEVYLAWMCSADYEGDLFSPNLDYERILIDGEVDVIVTNDGQAEYFNAGVDSEGQILWDFELIDGYVLHRDAHGADIFIERINGQTVINLPKDMSYSIMIKGKAHEKVQVRALELTVGHTNADRSQYAEMEMEPDTVKLLFSLPQADGFEEDIFIFVEDDTFDISDVAKGGSAEMIMNLRNLSAFSWLNLSWRDIVVASYMIPIIVVSLISILLCWLVGKHRVKRKKKNGVLPENAKFELYSSVCIVLTIALFLVQELFYWLMPTYLLFRALLKLAIGASVIYMAYRGYKKQKTETSKLIIITLLLCTVGDITINYNFLIGMIFYGIGIVLLGYQFIRFDKPEIWQWIMWGILAGISIYVMIQNKDRFGSLTYVMIVYSVLLMGLLSLSVTMPKRIRAASILFVAANIFLFFNEIHSITLLRHILALGIFYLAVITFARSTRFNDYPAPHSRTHKMPEEAVA